VYTYITKGQHYSSAPLQALQQLPFLSRIMVEAPNAKIVTGIMLLPLHKPLDIAEQLAEQIVDYNKRLGVNVINPAFQWVGTPHGQVLDALHLFAEEVMPKVRAAI